MFVTKALLADAFVYCYIKTNVTSRDHMTQSQWKTILIYLPVMKIQFLSLYSLLEGDLQSRIERLDYDDHCEKRLITKEIILRCLV